MIIDRLTGHARGIILYVIGCGFLTFLITIFKKIVNTYHLPISEVIFVRQLIIVVCLTPYMIRDRFNFFDAEAIKPNVWRNALFLVSTIFWYMGVTTTPVNDATTIGFLTPIIGSVMAVKFLHEKSSPRLWVGLLVCLCGTLIVKRPGFSSLDEGYIGYIALLAAVSMRGYIVILNKKLTKQFSVMQMMYYTHIVMFLGSALFFWQFKPMPAEALYLIGLAGIGFFGEFFFVYTAYKLCPASTLQPMDFSKLLFSIIFSYAILGEQITVSQISGGVVILLAYIFIIGKKDKKGN